MTVLFVLGAWIAVALTLSILLSFYMADYVWRIGSTPARYLFIVAFSGISWTVLLTLGILIVWP
ncbi:MAG: hypothetical protein ACYCX4_12930 [Bacillota bacterium]